MKCETFDELYDFLFNLTDITPEIGNIYKADNNIIGILELSKFDITKNIAAINAILESDIPLNKLYIINYEEFLVNIGFKNLITLYSNTIELVDCLCCDKKVDIINKHLQDTVYVFDIDHEYETLRFTPEPGVVYNLQYNDNKLLSYKHSAFSYKMHDDSIYFANTIYNNMPSVRVPLMQDFVIPANTFDSPLEDLDGIDLNIVVYLHIVKYGKKVDHLHKNKNTVIFDSDTFNKKIYLALCNNSSFRESWYNVYKDYTKDFSNADFYMNDIDVVIMNMANSEITVENVNNYATTFYLPTKNYFIFDNVDVTNPENNIVQQIYRLNGTVPFRIMYNNTNQLFDKVPPRHANEPYGMARFNQCVKYLIEHCTSDILVLIGDKIIMNKELNFDPSNIWSGYKVGSVNAFGYINIFNVKLMRELEIEFDNFEDFIKKLDEEDIKYSSSYPEVFGLTLPMDFDKYNGNIFRVAGTKRQIIFNYFLDTYKYNFNSYENDNRYNQL